MLSVPFLSLPRSLAYPGLSLRERNGLICGAVAIASNRATGLLRSVITSDPIRAASPTQAQVFACSSRNEMVFMRFIVSPRVSFLMMFRSILALSAFGCDEWRRRIAALCLRASISMRFATHHRGKRAYQSRLTDVLSGDESDMARRCYVGRNVGAATCFTNL